MNEPKNITVVVECILCQHQQESTSAAAQVGRDGEIQYYFGSSYRYCNLCDGHTFEAIEPKKPNEA